MHSSKYIGTALKCYEIKFLSFNLFSSFNIQYFQSGHEGLSMFWDGLMEPTVSINFTRILQPDFVSNFSKCYVNDCHAVVGRSVEITTTFPLEGAVVKVEIKCWLYVFEHSKELN